MPGADTEIACRLPRDSDLEPALVRRLSELVNAVYDEAESGMWKMKGLRTSPEEIVQLLRTQLYPDKVPQLATECDFTVWHKRL